MQQRLPRFQRVPTAVAERQITNRSLAVIATIARYRFIPTSLLVRVVDGIDDVTHRHQVTQGHLQQLFHRGLISRFAFPRRGFPGEFVYYLANPAGLRLLAEEGLVQPGDLDFEQVQRNRENAYEETNLANAEARIGQMVFLQHELMVSRFHAMLELGCRASGGQVELATWRQDTGLWQTVEAPRLKFDRSRSRWYEDGVERLPHRPDAFFTLRFPQAADGQQRANFFYEADRNSEDNKTINRKLRAYFQFIVKQRTHQTLFGIQRVRAVLFETPDVQRADSLREEARRPTVSGDTPTPLFWFTASEIFTKEQDVATAAGKIQKLPRFLAQPDFVLRPVWLSPVDATLHSLRD